MARGSRGPTAVEPLPLRVQAAFMALDGLQGVEAGSISPITGDAVGGRILAQDELGLRKAALETLRLFVGGEDNCGPVDPYQEQPSDYTQSEAPTPQPTAPAAAPPRGGFPVRAYPIPGQPGQYNIVVLDPEALE